MAFPESELIEIECYNCKGSGAVKVTTGFFADVDKVVPCPICRGEKIKKINPYCHNDKRQCLGDMCNLWDRNGDGGCIEKKALLKQLGRSK